MFNLAKIKKTAINLTNIFFIYFLPKKFMVSTAVINLTTCCNLHCVMCSVHQEKKESITMSQLDELLRQLKTFKIKSIMFAGGEPTLHKNFKKIVNKTYSRDFHIYMTTNGTQLNKLDAKTLKKFSRIYVSLDSIKNYQKIRGKNLFKHVDMGIHHLKNLGVPTDVTMTVQNLNYKEIEDVVAYCEKNGIGILLGRVLTNDSNYLVAKNKTISDYDSGYVTNLVRELSVKFPRIIKNKTEFLFQLFQKKMPRHNSCIRPLNTIQFLLNGDVLSCCGAYPKILGNAFQKDIQTIRKENFQYFISMLKGKSASDECKDCPWRLSRSEYTISIIKDHILN